MAVCLDPALRPAVEDVRRRLLERWPAGAHLVKWVEPHNLHLTVKFLGEVDDRVYPRVCEALRCVEGLAPFDLQLVGLGAFPRPRGARVLWVGVQQGATELAELAGQVDAALQPLGFPPEGRAFSPPLPFGRLRTPAYHPQPESALEDYARVKIGSQRVQSVELVESHLQRPGPVYKVRRSYQLGGG